MVFGAFMDGLVLLLILLYYGVPIRLAAITR